MIAILVLINYAVQLYYAKRFAVQSQWSISSCRTFISTLSTNRVKERERVRAIENKEHGVEKQRGNKQMKGNRNYPKIKIIICRDEHLQSSHAVKLRREKIQQNEFLFVNIQVI